MGPIETLAVRAWGRGVRIDAVDAGRLEEHSSALVAILDEGEATGRRDARRARAYRRPSKRAAALP